MLTATYTLVTMSVETASLKSSLASFQALVQKAFAIEPALTPGQVDYACATLHRLYQACHGRKVELYLAPEVRGASEAARTVLSELDGLTMAAANALCAAQDQARGAVPDSPQRVASFCAVLDSFCMAMLARLEREEDALFPLARSVISTAGWFSIANAMLASEANRKYGARAVVH